MYWTSSESYFEPGSCFKQISIFQASIILQTDQHISSRERKSASIPFNMSGKQNHYASAAKEAFGIYDKTGHAAKMKDLIANDNWKIDNIDRIAIVCLGVDWFQFAMIMRLKEYLQSQNKKVIKVYAQGSYKAILNIQDYKECLESYNVTSLDGDSPWLAPPILKEITSTTLLYAPSCIVDVMVKVLMGADPELYIGLAMDKLISTGMLVAKENSQGKDSQEGEPEEPRKRTKLMPKRDAPSKESIERSRQEETFNRAKKLEHERELMEIAQAFAEKHEWRAVPSTDPVGHPDENYKEASLFMYRRIGGWGRGFSTQSDLEAGTNGLSSKEEDKVEPAAAKTHTRGLAVRTVRK